VLLATVTVVGTVAALVSPSTSALAVAGSTFEETDGNMVVNDSTRSDWSSYASTINCKTPFADGAIDRPSGQGDDSFGQGSKDDQTTLQVVNGSIPNNKSDLARLYVASEKRGDDFVYFGWVRNNTLGTANFSIELNQVASSAVPVVGSSYTIRRTPGDLLFLYDFAQGGKADTFQLRMSRWVVSGAPKTACEASSTLPCWGKAIDIKKAGYANGSINKVDITDTLYPEPSGGPVNGAPQLTFGELAVDLTKAGVTTPCAGFGSAMIRSRASSAFDAELKDFIAPAHVSVGGGGTDTTGWRSYGDALTDRVFDSQLVTPAKSLGTAAASDTANPPTSQSNSVLELNVPPEDVMDTPKGSVLHTDLLTTSATSALTASDTSQTSIARVAGVNVLDGTVTASVIEADALTRATKTGATPGTGFSGLKDLRIDIDGSGGNPPVAISNNVAPNTRIDLSPAAFGTGSYVEVRRQRKSTTYPTPGTPLGTHVTYDGDVNEISMIHVHVTDRTPDELLPSGVPNPFADGDVTTDVLLASATAHSHSSGVLCEAAQAVEGHATVLRGNVGNLVGASLGNAALPDGGGGGADHQGLDSLSVGNPVLVTAGVSTSDTEGSWGALTSQADSQAKAAGLCVYLDALAGCDISADALESHVGSDGSGSSWSSTGGASFVNLVIMGHAVTVSPNRVQEIPGIGLVAVDELTCADGSAPSESTCSTSGPSSAMTVRALHILVTEPLPQPNALGLKLGSEIVIAESYSGATFVAL
jgi:hypothetical protein